MHHLALIHDPYCSRFG